VRLDRAKVIVAGLFSAKVEDYERQLHELSAVIRAHGAEVAATFVQRRGVSDGGVAAMDKPYSRRTLMTAGKVDEIAAACRALNVHAVIFVNDLTAHQRETLAEACDCPVLSATDLAPAPVDPSETSSR
jgi:50S ribosomal subunit-associated GTPase HflX